MRTVQINRRQSIWLIISLATALTFVLTACGANSGSGSTSTGSNPPTTTSGPNIHGCPSNAVVNNTPTPANIVLTTSNRNTTINAHQGDVIEIQLPFGQAWTGPTTSQGVLQLETPSGYARDTVNACVWRFTAQGTGSTQLNFYGKAMCKKGELCPQYIMSLPFTIKVK